MAGTVKQMSIIKQVLLLKRRGESNRGIARKLPINKETVNGYMQTVKANGWRIDDLLEVTTRNWSACSMPAALPIRTSAWRSS